MDESEDCSFGGWQVNNQTGGFCCERETLLEDNQEAAERGPEPVGAFGKLMLLRYRPGQRYQACHEEDAGH